MPTFEVRRTKPYLVSVTVDAANELAALRDAQRIFSGDAYDADAYEVSRQPLPPDDSGDARSEARYDYSDTDAQTEATEAARWGLSAEHPAASPSRQNQATTTREATMDDEFRELREVVEKVKSLDKSVELPYWDDWSVTLAEGVEKLLADAQAEEAEAARWGLGGAESDSEATEA